MDAALQAVVASGVPGLALAVERGGAVVYRKGYGLADVAARRPVEPSTRFELGSVTKQFTAAAILQLVAAGKLHLEDQLGEYVPQYAAGSAVTLRELLLQTSGIPDYATVPGFAEAVYSPPSFARLLLLIDGKRLEFTPGTRWRYSNTNYILLGRVVERASGMPFDAYLRAHVLAPAGMTRTATIADEPKLTDLAVGYDGPAGQPHPTRPFADGWAGAAGNLVADVDDVVKWDDAFFGGRIVAPADVALATTPVTLADGSSTGYGFGWVVDTFDGRKRLWHNGGTVGQGAANMVFPAENLRIVVLLNTAAVPPEAIAGRVFEALHPELAAANDQPAAGESAALTARAKAVLAHVQDGDLPRAQLAPALAARLTPATAAELKAELGPLGQPQAFIYKGKTAAGGVSVARYRVRFAASALDLQLGYDAAGKLAILSLRPQ